MTLIEQKTLTQAMRMLDAIGCVYAIKDSSNQIHGTLEIAQDKKRKLAYPMGTLTHHIKMYIPEDLGVGKVAHVPCADFGNDVMTRTCSAYMVKKYGSGSYKTVFDKANNLIEIIRYS